MTKPRSKADKIEPEWKRYAALYTKENEDALNAMRRVSELHRAIVKRARQKQIQYEEKNKNR